MPPGEHGPATDDPPDWALEEAGKELYDESDPGVLAKRARVIARETQTRDDERHDEYDDPDEGGEA